MQEMQEGVRFGHQRLPDAEDAGGRCVSVADGCHVHGLDAGDAEDAGDAGGAEQTRVRCVR
jgi:hypothetical protein